jgi:hypothetical protein
MAETKPTERHEDSIPPTARRGRYQARNTHAGLFTVLELQPG